MRDVICPHCCLEHEAADCWKHWRNVADEAEQRAATAEEVRQWKRVAQEQSDLHVESRADAEAAERALRALVNMRPSELPPLLEVVVSEGEVMLVTSQGVASCNLGEIERAIYDDEDGFFAKAHGVYLCRPYFEKGDPECGMPSGWGIEGANRIDELTPWERERAAVGADAPGSEAGGGEANG